MLTTIKVAALSFLLSAFSLAAPKNLDLGGMELSISDAPTAQIFHIVDQLSQWDIYTLDQYARWAAATHLLDQRDRELLQQHAEMRKRSGWGHGFEQTFLVEDSIEDATAKGISAQFLSATEANTERDVLLHFAPKLEPLLRQRRTEIAALQQQLVAEQARLTPFMVQLASFVEVKNPPIVMVFLVANTDEPRILCSGTIRPNTPFYMAPLISAEEASPYERSLQGGIRESKRNNELRSMWKTM
jgi:hypothetical protein